MKKLRLIFVAILVVIGIIMGGWKVKETIEHQEMVNIVNSEEAREIYRKRLKRIDSKAFEENGIITSYDIDYSSILHNPMGGVMVSIYVNGNKNYIFSFTLDRDPNTGKLISEGGVNDPTIIEKVKTRDND